MNKVWIRASLIRALKTVAQTAVATIGTTATLGQVDWRLVASASILAGILSILTSIGGLPEVKAEEEKALAEKSDIPHGYFEEMEESHDDSE